MKQKKYIEVIISFVSEFEFRNWKKKKNTKEIDFVQSRKNCLGYLQFSQSQEKAEK